MSPQKPLSHPSRVRGLKYSMRALLFEVFFVAPFTGAWIEIINYLKNALHTYVAPFTGAWIEI